MTESSKKDQGKGQKQDKEVVETAEATKRQEIMQQGSKDGKEVSGQAMSSTPNSKPSNEQLTKENKQISHRPEDLKDTDVEDEFKDTGGKFRKQTDKARL